MQVDILGLGESLREYKPTGNLTIGVNDIGAYYHADVVICVDNLYRFKGERKKTLCTYKPKEFWSHRLEFKQFQPGFKEYKIGGTHSLKNMGKKNIVVFGFTSVYAAITLAYNIYGATEINVYGCDLVNHTTLGEKNMLNKTVKHLFELFLYLKEKSVTVNLYCGLSKLQQIGN
jgi:hypothetical protein